MTARFLLLCLAVISRQQGETIFLVKHYCKYVMILFSSENSLPSYVVNSCSVNSFKTINVGVVNVFIHMFIMTISVILPEMETV